CGAFRRLGVNGFPAIGRTPKAVGSGYRGTGRLRIKSSRTMCRNHRLRWILVLRVLLRTTIVLTFRARGFMEMPATCGDLGTGIRAMRTWYGRQLTTSTRQPAAFL